MLVELLAISNAGPRNAGLISPDLHNQQLRGRFIHK